MNAQKIKTLLVDDEEKSRRVLKTLLARFCPNIEICAEAENIDQAFELSFRHAPQLVLLDIMMPTGDGFSLLKKYREVPFEVIFVTSFDQYAMHAIKFSALDFLLKPVEVQDLVAAIQKAERRIIEKSNRNLQFVSLLNNIEESGLEKNVAVHVNEKVKLVKVHTLTYIESEDRYSNLFSSDGSRYTVPKTLKEFEDFLQTNPLFVRISKTHIINLNFVKDYKKGEPCIIEMRDGRAFEISRRKKQEVLEVLKGKTQES